MKNSTFLGTLSASEMLEITNYKILSKQVFSVSMPSSSSKIDPPAEEDLFTQKIMSRFPR